jgi:esterase/lipase superfamily enzyme
MILHLALVAASLTFQSSGEMVRQARAQVVRVDVAGTAVDEAGGAVAGATVVLTNRATSEQQTAQTDASGNFIFHLVVLGSYTIRATFRGLAGQIELEVPAGAATPVSVKMFRPRLAARPAPAPAPPPVLAMTAPANYYKVKVYYATDRKPTGSAEPADFYGGDRDPSETLALGACEVSIPRDHRPGELEAPSIWRLEFREDPEKHVVLLGVHPQGRNEFYADLASTVDASPKKEAFVFIHGYKTTFEDAARRTGQLAYDLNFHGAAIFYSWPSKGDLDGYPADEGTIMWTTPHLVGFLRQIAAQANVKTVHLIAHSMGNRALTQALANLASPPASALPHFREVILAAPDVDRDIFKQLAEAIQKTADRVTLYASSHDEALAASKRLHDFPRAGEAGTSLLVLKGIDTVDVSAVDSSFLGHSYFGENTSVISDIQRLLAQGSPPNQRSCLLQATMLNLSYWIFARDTCR